MKILRLYARRLQNKRQTNRQNKMSVPHRGSQRKSEILYFRLEVDTSCSSALRGACSCILVWLCGQSADDALPPLVARWHALVYLSSCALDALLSLVARWHALVYLSCALDALLSLVARWHALVYLWCWYSSMVSILACSCVLMVLVQQYGIYTRPSCSFALKVSSCALAMFVGTTVG